MQTEEIIDALQKELSSIDKAEKRLGILLHELDDISYDLGKTRDLVDKELFDVQKLENTATSFLYKKFLGDIDQKLDQEREEYLKAILRFEDLENKIKLLEFEKEILEKKISKKEHIYNEIQTLIISTTSTQNNHSLSNKLKDFQNKINEKTNLLKEIEEASIAASELRIHLNNLVKNLDSFEKNNDEGIRILYYDQVQQIKNFREVISAIDQLEQNLNKQLEDINYISEQKNLYTPYISFFENMHSAMMFGWISSTHLRRAKNCIKDNIKNTDQILAFLKAEKPLVEYAIQSLEKEKRLYLENC